MLFQLKAQVLPVGFPVFEEYERRFQLIDTTQSQVSFLKRPLVVKFDFLSRQFPEFLFDYPELEIYYLPVLATSRFNNKRPYGWGDYGMIPNKGFR